MADYVRKLNEDGLHAFDQYIQDLRNGGTTDTPKHLLTDVRYSESLDFDIVLEQQEFETRYALGEYLKSALDEVKIQSMLGDPGFWSWLALYWFDQLCPPGKDNSRKPSQSYNYILSTNYNHRPRHAIRTTWILVNSYGEKSFFLLSKQPNERGELIEQLAARQYFISCRGIIEAGNRLYYDPDRKTFKRGATSRKRKGNIRRFINYLQQLDLTYDLYSLHGESIIGMLPKEYEGFLAMG